MSWIRQLGRRVTTLHGAAKREFLRDPAVILFERKADPSGAPARDAVGQR